MDYLNDKQALEHFDTLLKDKEVNKKVNAVEVDAIIKLQMAASIKAKRSLLIFFSFIWFGIATMVFVWFLRGIHQGNVVSSLFCMLVGLPLLFLEFIWISGYDVGLEQQQILYVKFIASLNGHNKAEDQDYEDAKLLVESNYQKWVLRLPANKIIMGYKEEMKKI